MTGRRVAAAVVVSFIAALVAVLWWTAPRPGPTVQQKTARVDALAQAYVRAMQDDSLDELHHVMGSGWKDQYQSHEAERSLQLFGGGKAVGMSYSELSPPAPDDAEGGFTLHVKDGTNYGVLVRTDQHGHYAVSFNGLPGDPPIVPRVGDANQLSQ